MRKLILVEWVSLDGHVTDKNGGMDFFTQTPPEQNVQSDKDQLTFLETIDTILLGRKTYELFADYWPKATTDTEIIADKLNETKKLVFSNSLGSAPWGNWEEAEVVKGDAIHEIKRLKSLPGKNMIMWGSIALAQALIKENLIDEYHIQLCPVLTGGGRKLFTGEEDTKSLSLTDAKKYETGIVFLKYQLTAK